MNNETIEIKKENAMLAYETARKTGADSTMKVLEALFGEETFKPKDITGRIKTFEDAARAMGINDPEEWEDNHANLEPDILAYMKLRIICAALNEGWEPQFTEDEWCYYPWFCLYTQQELDVMNENEKQERCMIDISGRINDYYCGFGCASSNYVPSNARATFGSRLCLKSPELATYCGRQFIGLWADLCLTRGRGGR